MIRYSLAVLLTVVDFILTFAFRISFVFCLSILENIVSVARMVWQLLTQTVGLLCLMHFASIAEVESDVNMHFYTSGFALHLVPEADISLVCCDSADSVGFWDGGEPGVMCMFLRPLLLNIALIFQLLLSLLTYLLLMVFIACQLSL
jgi:hypothetical protein